MGSNRLQKHAHPIVFMFLILPLRCHGGVPVRNRCLPTRARGEGAAATKYNVYASLSNTPIYYMTRIDGWAHAKWGPAGMLHTEAAFGFVGLLAFLGVTAGVKRRRALVPAETL